MSLWFDNLQVTDIDNVFLLRHAKRLPFEKRDIYDEVKCQHRDYPIDGEIICNFVKEIQGFVEAIWYDPKEALKRGSFV